VSKFPSVSSGLIEFISRCIEENGQCSFRDTNVLGFLWGSRNSCEGKIRLLRLFARQHEWAVASNAGRSGVFTRRFAYLAAASHTGRSNYGELHRFILNEEPQVPIVVDRARVDDAR